MKRNGFTMVELIFVIVIIGILAATALPKFSGVKDQAKINSEISAMASLESAIIAAKQFQYDDFGNTNVNWHGATDAGDNTEVGGNAGARTTYYTSVNTNEKVLEKVMDKNENFKIVAFAAINSADDSGNQYANGIYHDLIYIEGPASDSLLGIDFPSVTGDDIPGKIDKNDFWAFNTSSTDINISGTNISVTTVGAGKIQLIDVNGTGTLNYENDDADAVLSTGTNLNIQGI